MKTYAIKYTEGLHINLTYEVKARNMNEALTIFYHENPNASHESIEVREDGTISTPANGTGSN